MGPLNRTDQAAPAVHGTAIRPEVTSGEHRGERIRSAIAGFTCRPSTTATPPGAGQLERAAADWALEPDAHVSSSSKTVAPASRAAAR